MRKELIDFIHENEDLIDDNNWEDIYDKISNDDRFEYYSDVGEFTQIIRSVGIMPENYLEKIPDGFLTETDVNECIIPDHITEIGYSAFADCLQLQKISIPASVNKLSGYCFGECENLQEIYFNATITQDLEFNRIFNHVGQNTSGVKLTIGKDVRSIPYTLFCPDRDPDHFNLSEIYIEENTKLTTIRKDQFSGYRNLTIVNIGEGVERIESFAFTDNPRLKKVIIPKSVTQIDRRAFYKEYTPDDDFDIYYRGSRADWLKLSMAKDYHFPKEYNYTGA